MASSEREKEGLGSDFRLSYPSQREVFTHLKFLQRELVSKKCSLARFLHPRLACRLSAVHTGIVHNTSKSFLRIFFDANLSLELKQGVSRVVWRNGENQWATDLYPAGSFEMLAEDLLFHYLDHKGVRIDVLHANGFVIDILKELRFPISVGELHVDVKGQDLLELLEKVNIDGAHIEVKLAGLEESTNFRKLWSGASLSIHLPFYSYNEEELKSFIKNSFNPPPRRKFRLKLNFSRYPPPPDLEKTLQRALRFSKTKRAHLIQQGRSIWGIRRILDDSDFDVLFYCSPKDYNGANYLVMQTIDKSEKNIVHLECL